MDLKTAAGLIKSEYAERTAAAQERYLDLLSEDEELYAAEKNMRCAVLDGKPVGTALVELMGRPRRHENEEIWMKEQTK